MSSRHGTPPRRGGSCANSAGTAQKGSAAQRYSAHKKLQHDSRLLARPADRGRIAQNAVRAPHHAGVALRRAAVLGTAASEASCKWMLHGSLMIPVPRWKGVAVAPGACGRSQHSTRVRATAARHQRRRRACAAVGGARHSWDEAARSEISGRRGARDRVGAPARRDAKTTRDAIRGVGFWRFIGQRVPGKRLLCYT